MIAGPLPGDFSHPEPSSTAGPVVPVRRTSPLTIALAWAVVSIPALWGVAQTARTSVRLFEPPAAQTAPGSAGAAQAQSPTSAR